MYNTDTVTYTLLGTRCGDCPASEILFEKFENNELDPDAKIIKTTHGLFPLEELMTVREVTRPFAIKNYMEFKGQNEMLIDGSPLTLANGKLYYDGTPFEWLSSNLQNKIESFIEQDGLYHWSVFVGYDKFDIE